MFFSRAFNRKIFGFSSIFSSSQAKLTKSSKFSFKNTVDLRNLEKFNMLLVFIDP
jgi:hypothetical protein